MSEIEEKLNDISIQLEIISRQLCKINKSNYDDEKNWVLTYRRRRDNERLQKRNNKIK